jgi:integrase
MALSTEKVYVNWIRRFILFHGVRHPGEMGKKEVEAFLTHLAVEGNVAESTQNQALSALLFLYREVLESEFGWLEDVVRAKKQRHVPVVFTHDEAVAVLALLEGTYWLIGKLLYGSGLRVMECLRLRVKDLDFARMQVTVRDTKGREDRFSLLPHTLKDPLEQHLRHVRKMHEDAMQQGYGGVQLPHALHRSTRTCCRATAGRFVARQMRYKQTGTCELQFANLDALQPHRQGVVLRRRKALSGVVSQTRCSWPKGTGTTTNSGLI